MDVSLDDKQLRHLNKQARDELAKAARDFSDDVLREAGRLEEAQHVTEGDPEITSAHVHQAAELLRKGYVRRPKSGGDRLREAVSYAATLLLGFVTPNLGKEPWAAPVFALLVFVGVGSYFFGGRTRD